MTYSYQQATGTGGPTRRAVKLTCGDGGGMSADEAGADTVPDGPTARSVAVITIDRDGAILEFSPEAERMFGHQRADVLGAQMAAVIVPPRLRAAHATGFDRYLKTGVGPLFDKTIEVPAIRADGSEFTVELVITRVRVDGHEVFTGMLREVKAPPSIPGELALSEAFFRTLIDRSPIAISVVHRDGSWRWSSEAGLRLHGPLDTNVEAVLPAEDRAALQQLIQAAAQDADGSQVVDLQVRGLDGAWHALAVAAENMLSEPAVHGIGLYATDMTRLHEAEQRVRIESARLSTLISSLGVGILLQDADQRVVLSNRAYTRMFGIDAPPEALFGQVTTDLARQRQERFPDEHTMQARVQELIAGGASVTGEELAFSDGRVVERDYAPVHLDGTNEGHLWVFRDVTEQSLIRRGLEERNRALAELASLKTEFIATASHELRTPLTSILTFAHLLEEPGCGPAERDRAIGAISRNADRMLRLVDDLILLVTLEAGTAPLRVTPVELPALIRSAIETWNPVAARTGVSVAEDVGKGPRLRADPRHLHQLVDTLLATAVATTPRGGQITVYASFDDPLWTIKLDCSSVAAKGGAGDHIFTRPGRHDDPSAAHSNALAVLLSRAIVARHGGEMSSPATPDGAAYVVRLPLAPPDDDPPS
jgi:PAS domain S-box-containing protein